jgi:hypothetical protein
MYILLFPIRSANTFSILDEYGSVNTEGFACAGLAIRVWSDLQPRMSNSLITSTCGIELSFYALNPVRFDKERMNPEKIEN